MADSTSIIKEIGETQDPLPDGSCEDPLFIFRPDIGKCGFPDRLDVGIHFLRTGGYNGWKVKNKKIKIKILKTK